MISTHLLASTGAIAAVTFALGSGWIAAVDVLSPPLISGSGYVETKAKAGDDVMVNWVITKRTDCPGASSRIWSGEGGFHLSEVMQATSIPQNNDAQRYVVPTSVPEMAPDGKLTLKIKGYFDCQDKEREWFTLGPVVIVGD